MCLATVYKESDDTVICRNVSKILVEGEKVIIRDIMGEETSIEGKIDSNYSVDSNCEETEQLL